MNWKRVVIVGTAPNWAQAPWHDPDVTIVSLNDAYALKPPRWDAWYETHPIDRFVYQDGGIIHANQIPYGSFVRPRGHVEWLKAQSQAKPVFLHQAPTGAGWGPHAQRFPVEQVMQGMGKWETEYWASGPAYILAHVMLMGATEIQVYGINLATAQEYRDQRPQWEFLLGRFLGRKVTQRTEGARRIFDGEGVRLVLPTDCPILAHGWQYGYQPKPLPSPAQIQLERAAQEKGALMQTLAGWPVWRPKGPRIDRLKRLQALENDAHMRLQAQAIAPSLVVSTR